MTRALIGIVAVLCLIALAAIVAVIVTTVVLTDKLDDERAGTTLNTVKTDQQNDPLACESVQDIAIIGAGISGSYAAWRMRSAGMSVALYEYSNRIGGRCHTVKFDGIPDVNVEMGAMRFKPLEHPLLNKTVNELGLKVIDFSLGYGGGGDTLYYLRGKHLKYDELGVNAPYDLHPDHRIDPDTFQWQLLKNFTDVDSSKSGYDTQPNKLFIKSKDGIPLYRQSRESFYAKYFSTDTQQYIKDISAWDSAFVDNAAANRLPRTDPSRASSTPNPVKTVESGFQSIPETMVDQFLKASSRHSFHRNHHLKAVKKNEDGHYGLTFQPTQTSRGVTKDYINLPRKHTCAKKVFLAIPRMALEYLDWDQLKHPDIMDYIRNALVDSPAGKMFFAYGDTWWRDLALAAPFVISTTPLRQTYDYAASPSTGKGVLNLGYPSLYTEIWRDVQLQGNHVPGVGDDTIAMTTVGVDMARTIYAEIVNISVSDVGQPDYAVMSIWDRYPIGAAWYLWRSGYVWEDVENKMTRPSPDDDVFLISNTFSKNLLQAWLEGGLEIVERTIAKYFPDI